MTKVQREIVDKELIMLDKKDIMELTRWSKGVVDKMFAHDKEFPAIKKGKKCLVELSAFKKYLSKRRTSGWDKKSYNDKEESVESQIT